MPIYEYVCNDCGYDFERIQSFSDDPVDTCPHCQGSVRRVISSVGIIFKGSGWYITDSKRQLSASPSSARQIADGSGDSDGEKPTAKSESTGATESTRTAKAGSADTGKPSGD